MHPALLAIGVVMRREEQALQKLVVAHLRKYMVPPYFMCALRPVAYGGGWGGFYRGILAKQMGAVAGPFDLYFRRMDVHRGHWPSYWIELKSPAGDLRPAQEAFHQVARSWGDQVGVARSLAEVLELLRRWGFTFSEEPVQTTRIKRAMAAALADHTLGEPVVGDPPVRRVPRY